MTHPAQTITGEHPSLQVIVRSFGGSSRGREGTLPPLRTPSNRVYHIEGNHGGPFAAVVEGVMRGGR